MIRGYVNKPDALVHRGILDMSKRASSGPRCPNYEQCVAIWLMLFRGVYQHDIAAAFGFNQGRISEVKSGERHPSSRDEALRQWPKSA